MKLSVRSVKGFTLIEMMIVMALLVLTTIPAFLSLSSIQKSGAKQGARDLDAVLFEARRQAMNGVNNSNWGVYFPYDETERTTDEAIIFSGDSYAARDADFDINRKFSGLVRFMDVDLSGVLPSDGDDNEIVFGYLTGTTTNYGSILVNSFDSELEYEISEYGFVTETD